MQTYENYLNQFQHMNYVQKKKKLLNMLDVVREQGNIFEDIYNLINNIENIDEKLLDNIFKILASSMYKQKAEQMEQSIEELENTKSKLEKIKDREKEENDKDSKDADSLLEKI